MANVHARYIDVLETEGWLDRALEFLPSDKQIAERQLAGGGLTTPEFAVLIAYTKNTNVAEMVRSDLPDEPAFEDDLVDTFPHPLRKRFGDSDRRPSVAPGDHRHGGGQPDGQPLGHLVRPPHDRGHRRIGGRRDPGVGGGARRVRLRRLVGRDRRPRGLWCPQDTQMGLFLDCRRMVERSALWVLRHRRPPFDLAATTA